MNLILFMVKTKKDRHIVMDNVFGLADFLTVARKFSYHYVYIFHIIHPEKTIWRSIISQTNIFYIFPASVPFNSIKKST